MATRLVGSSGETEVRFGVMLKIIGWISGIGAVVVAAGMIGFVSKATEAFEQVAVIYERQAFFIQRLEDIEARLQAEGDVLTQAEFNEWRESQIRAREGNAKAAAKSR